MAKNWFGLTVCCLATLVLGLAIGSSGLVPLWRGQSTPPNFADPGLDSLLYVQTAAEYEACCLQAYHVGTERLRLKLLLPGDDKRPAAVIMDLDETVLDNSRFQAYLVLHGLTYSDELWAIWERDHPDDVRLIPGAKAFIDFAEQEKVTVIYISNRLTKYASSTEAALKHLGLNTDNIAERLLLRDDSSPSDKTARRKKAEEHHRVLLLFGDNLRDFSEEFVAPKLKPDDNDGQLEAIAKRREQVQKEAAHFGDDWIILPNPVYGEWTRLLGNAPRNKFDAVNLKPPGP